MADDNYHRGDLVLVEGLNSVPLFPDWKAYENFRYEWGRDLKPALGELDLRRANSVMDSMRHAVD